MCSTARAILLALAGLLPAAAQAAGGEADKWAIKSAGEAAGRLQIVLRDGRVFTLPHEADVCSYDGATISPDRLTVGWVEGTTFYGEGEKPCALGAQYVAYGPVFWRAGHVLRDFSLSAGVIEWSYLGSDRIAMHAGPTHFDYSDSCTVYDIGSGHALKHWSRNDKTPPPDWASVCLDY